MAVTNEYLYEPPILITAALITRVAPAIIIYSPGVCEEKHILQQIQLSVCVQRSGGEKKNKGQLRLVELFRGRQTKSADDRDKSTRPRATLEL